MGKRCFDLLFASLGLIALSPVLLVLAALIKADSPGPVFFRQERVGLRGRTFRIHKFRTMTADAATQGPQLTIGADRRITRCGAVLRRYKLDELPQLIDVVWGDMSLVGPRPEVPYYVSYYPPEIRELVLSVRPGITDRASVEFRNESALLQQAPSPQQEYLQTILPIKLSYYVEYARHHSLAGDVRIILATILAIFRD